MEKTASNFYKVEVHSFNGSFEDEEYYFRELNDANDFVVADYRDYTGNDWEDEVRDSLRENGAYKDDDVSYEIFNCFFKK